MLYRITLIIALACAGLLYGTENASETLQKKYRTSIVAFFKNESKYLKEWIEYHRMLGIDHFYLYDNQSSDLSISVLNPYIQEGIVSLFYWPDHIPQYLMQQEGMQIFNRKIQAYEHAAKYAAMNESEWLLALDIDDFLVPVHANSIQEVVDEYEQYTAIRCPTLSFQAKHYNEWMQPCVLIESSDLIADEEWEKESGRMLFKPKEYTYFQWPPYERQFKKGSCVTELGTKELRIHKYRYRHRNELNFHKARLRMDIEDRGEAALRFVAPLKVRLQRK